MWSYYGAKTNIVDLYPPPKFGKIIEPFAGSARYALKYFDRDVLLVDKYPVIVNIWNWIKNCSSKDILSLPRPKKGETLDDFTFDCIEAKHFMGFIIHFAAFSPGKKPTPHYTDKRPNGINFSLQRVAANVHKVRHWQIKEGSFDEINNEEASWFIDPPYQFGGQSYIHSNKSIDFNLLADWCKSRSGQVIVCENMKADWMPFVPLTTQRVRTGMHPEAIWSNYPTAYDITQQTLF